jgi:hypothetical protein
MTAGSHLHDGEVSMDTRIKVFLSLSLILYAAGAQAQSDIGTPMGSLFVSGSEGAYEPFVAAPAFTPFRIFVVTELDYADVGLPALNGVNTMAALEFRLDIDPRIVVLNTVFGYGDGQQIATAPDYVLGFAPGLPSGMFAPVATIDAMLLEEATDAYVLIEGVVDIFSSFENGEPGWAERGLSEDCTNRVWGTPEPCLRNFVRIEGMVVNCTDLPACRAVPTERMDWGGVKARY